MLVFETNRPWVLDPAVQSRITQSIEFEPPTVEEISTMFKLYTDKYIRKLESEQRKRLKLTDRDERTKKRNKLIALVRKLKLEQGE